METNISKPSFIKNLIITGQLTQLIIYICTGVAVSVFILLAILAFIGIVTFATGVDFLVFAVLSGSGIYGMYTFMKIKKIRKIDTIFPDFVRDLAESRRAGMTFTKAILFAAKGNYGFLTPEIQRIAQQVSWGSSVNDALTEFAKRMNTKLINRTISLIIESSKSGGNVADVLDAASRDAREIKMLEAERRAMMGSYVVVIYVGMFVFLVIIAVLCAQFIPAMVGEGSKGMAAAMGGGASMGRDDIVPIFFYATLIQGFGSGLVAGVFEDGNFSSGVKHMFIIVLVVWFMFKFVIGV